MEEKKLKKEEIQSRREFFKKAAKGALPILGAVVLSSIPVVSKANDTNMGCTNGCYYSCYNSCRTSCYGECKGTCKVHCNSSCYDSCVGSCHRSCNVTCSGGCQSSSY